MFQRLLIANRGEIAVRIIRTCREMGIAAIAVYSDADAGAPHVLLADRAVRIGPAAPAESYLSIPAILDAARQTGAEAIHPGYGFLSEDARFAAACLEAGLAFIGPPPAVIERLGSKIAARQIAAQAGVPAVPGETPADQRDEAVAAAIGRLGLPALLKPAAGGGGIGMRAIHDEAAIPAAIAQARREATAAFGDGTLYVERLIERPRHVEIQVIADRHGAVRHLFERECSLQRRHQKIVEETPSPALTPRLRGRMGEAAVAIARAAGYENAGTVEFLLDGTGDEAHFYFLEVNTRLQVEHPITEETTGIDLVRAQIACAAGEPLPWAQEAIRARGHAIELRVYAEDPAAGDLPQAGPLLVYRPPSMPGIRVDSGAIEGGAVSVHYDPLLAKLVAAGDTRETARRRALAAIRGFPVLGVRTNLPLLAALLEHPRFIAGDLDTRLVDMEGPALRSALGAEPPPEVHQVAAAARAAGSTGPPDRRAALDPWSTMQGWRAGGSRPADAGRHDAAGRQEASGGRMAVATERIAPLGHERYRITDEGRHRLAHAIAIGPDTWVFLDGRVYVVPVARAARAQGGDGPLAAASLSAPMPATVVAVHVQPGQMVARGDVLVVLEAMKMEVAIAAPRDGRVGRVACRPGDLVQPGPPLVTLEEPGP